MRVCFLNDNFYRSSGITKVLERLASSASFSDIELFCVGCETVQGQRVENEEQTIVPADRYKTFLLMDRTKFIPELLRFAQWLKATKCELVHVHHRRLATLCRLVAPLTGVRILFTGHLTFPDATWFRMLAPNDLTGVSPSVVQYLERATNASHISLIYNPHLFPATAPVRAPSAPKRVVSIGRLDSVKMHWVLIEAWEQLRIQGVTAVLDIIGEGPLRPELTELIRSKGLTEQVRLLGFLDNLDQRLAEYDFNVLVSETEGFPNVVVEAAMHSIPSLVTDVAGSRDTLQPGLALPNGIPCGDVSALVDALSIWLKSPQELVDDGVRFFSFLRGLCERDLVSAQYKKLFEDLLSNRQYA